MTDDQPVSKSRQVVLTPRHLQLAEDKFKDGWAPNDFDLKSPFQHCLSVVTNMLKKNSSDAIVNPDVQRFVKNLVCPVTYEILNAPNDTDLVKVMIEDLLYMCIKCISTGSTCISVAEMFHNVMVIIFNASSVYHDRLKTIHLTTTYSASKVFSQDEPYGGICHCVEFFNQFGGFTFLRAIFEKPIGIHSMLMYTRVLRFVSPCLNGESTIVINLLHLTVIKSHQTVRNFVDNGNILSDESELFFKLLTACREVLINSGISTNDTNLVPDIDRWNELLMTFLERQFNTTNVESHLTALTELIAVLAHNVTDKSDGFAEQVEQMILRNSALDKVILGSTSVQVTELRQSVAAESVRRIFAKTATNFEEIRFDRILDYAQTSWPQVTDHVRAQLLDFIADVCPNTSSDVRRKFVTSTWSFVISTNDMSTPMMSRLLAVHHKAIVAHGFEAVRVSSVLKMLNVLKGGLIDDRYSICVLEYLRRLIQSADQMMNMTANSSMSTTSNRSTKKIRVTQSAQNRVEMSAMDLCEITNIHEIIGERLLNFGQLAVTAVGNGIQPTAETRLFDDVDSTLEKYVSSATALMHFLYLDCKVPITTAMLTIMADTVAKSKCDYVTVQVIALSDQLVGCANGSCDELSAADNEDLLLNRLLDAAPSTLLMPALQSILPPLLKTDNHTLSIREPGADVSTFEERVREFVWDVALTNGDDRVAEVAMRAIVTATDHCLASIAVEHRAALHTQFWTESKVHLKAGNSVLIVRVLQMLDMYLQQIERLFDGERHNRIHQLCFVSSQSKVDNVLSTTDVLAPTDLERALPSIVWTGNSNMLDRMMRLLCKYPTETTVCECVMRVLHRLPSDCRIVDQLLMVTQNRGGAGVETSEEASPLNSQPKRARISPPSLTVERWLRNLLNIDQPLFQLLYRLQILSGILMPTRVTEKSTRTANTLSHEFIEGDGLNRLCVVIDNCRSNPTAMSGKINNEIVHHCIRVIRVAISVPTDGAGSKGSATLVDKIHLFETTVKFLFKVDVTTDVHWPHNVHENGEQLTLFYSVMVDTLLCVPKTYSVKHDPFLRLFYANETTAFNKNIVRSLLGVMYKYPTIADKASTTLLRLVVRSASLMVTVVSVIIEEIRLHLTDERFDQLLCLIDDLLISPSLGVANAVLHGGPDEAGALFALISNVLRQQSQSTPETAEVKCCSRLMRHVVDAARNDLETMGESTLITLVDQAITNDSSLMHLYKKLYSDE